MGIPATLQQLGRGQMMQNAARIKQMMQTIRAAANPQAALNMMMMNNPQMKQVMEIVNQYGGDSMKALEETAAEFGMTPDDVLRLLR